MNKEQQELLDEAYENWKEKGRYFWEEQVDAMFTSELGEEKVDKISKEWFINKCKTDTEFSENWGLKIEERELGDKERLNTLTQNEQRLIYERVQSFKNIRRKKLKDFLDEQKIPTRLITITYNDKTLKSYE